MARLVTGFPPLSCPDSVAVVLGTLPSQQSLDAAEYYANPRNSFWDIVGALYGFRRNLDYNLRCEKLQLSGLACWDVLHSAERAGSVDSSIIRGSEMPNDFVTFFRHHPKTRAVFFNGDKALTLFARLVLPSLPEQYRSLPRFPLPSTSPARAISKETKLQAWRQIVEMTTAG